VKTSVRGGQNDRGKGGKGSGLKIKTTVAGYTPVGVLTYWGAGRKLPVTWGGGIVKGEGKWEKRKERGKQGHTVPLSKNMWVVR